MEEKRAKHRARAAVERARAAKASTEKIRNMHLTLAALHERAANEGPDWFGAIEDRPRR